MEKTGTHSYTWDAEERNTKIDGGASANIVYNALGQMVNNLGNDTLYDPAGERIAGPGWSVVPGGNVPLVKWNSSYSYFIHSNALGSSTFVTDQMGNVKQDQIFYPGDGSGNISWDRRTADSPPWNRW